MTRLIKGIAFDFEGPMVEFEKEGHHTAHRLAALDAGIEISHEDALQNIQNLIGGPESLIMQQLWNYGRSRGITPLLTPQEMCARSAHHFSLLFEEIVNGTRKIEPRPGFVKALETVRTMGLKVTIGTSTHVDHFWTYFAKSGLRKLFDPGEVVIADEKSDLRHKPEPDVFLQTARVMGIDPPEQLIFEDSVRGVKAGVAAGSTVVGLTVYDDPRAIIPLYEAGAVRVFCDWREINLFGLIENLESR